MDNIQTRPRHPNVLSYAAGRIATKKKKEHPCRVYEKRRQEVYKKKKVAMRENKVLLY